MLFPLIVTIALSIASPVFAHHLGEGSDDSSYGSSSSKYGSSSSDDSGFSAMQDQWRREAADAERRNQERAIEMNRPQAEPEPSWVNPTPSYGVYGPGNTMQVCRQAGNNVYCF